MIMAQQTPTDRGKNISERFGEETRARHNTCSSIQRQLLLLSQNAVFLHFSHRDALRSVFKSLCFDTYSRPWGFEFLHACISWEHMGVSTTTTTTTTICVCIYIRIHIYIYIYIYVMRVYCGLAMYSDMGFETLESTFRESKFWELTTPAKPLCVYTYLSLYT